MKSKPSDDRSLPKKRTANVHESKPQPRSSLKNLIAWLKPETPAETYRKIPKRGFRPPHQKQLPDDETATAIKEFFSKVAKESDSPEEHLAYVRRRIRQGLGGGDAS